MIAPKYYGKYRGQVEDNEDPLMLGRILANVPAIIGMPMNWALPCTPYAGFGVGFYAIPPIGANVWVEFEQGDPNYPIWSGCFWDEGQVPNEPVVPLKKVFQTESITMILNDTPEEGGFTLLVNPPAVDVPLSMIFNSEGIQINCPEAQVMMTPEMINITLPTSEMNMTAETIEINAGDITLTAEEAIELSAGADISIEAGGAVEVTGGGDASIEAGGAVEVTGGGDVAIEAGGAVEVTGGADVAITAGAAIEVTAGVDIAITAGAAIEITTVADIALTAVTMMMTALVEVNGDLLIDGQQPLVI